jgi:small-conductance mechanosensitive channel
MKDLINKKFVIASDLHFAIDKIFKEHDISIAFPQMDVHLKFDPKNRPKDNG